MTVDRRAGLEAAIARRYGRLADISASIEQACEQSATRRLAPAQRANRTRWPRTAWRSFINQAQAQIGARKPEILRLRRELRVLEHQATCGHPP